MPLYALDRPRTLWLVALFCGQPASVAFGVLWHEPLSGPLRAPPKLPARTPQTRAAAGLRLKAWDGPGGRQVSRPLRGACGSLGLL